MKKRYGVLLNLFALIAFLNVAMADGLSTTPGQRLHQGGAVLPVQGGTGIRSYAVGDTLYASSTNTLVRLPDVATGSFFVSGGVNTAPAWTAASSLSPAFVGTNFTGTAASLTAGNVTTNANLTGPITSVGNAVASISAHGAMMGNGTSAINTIAPSTSGNVLTSNGTDWTSAAAPGGKLPRTTQSTTYAPTTTDNSSQIVFTGSSAATWTIVAGATNGSGWFAYFVNAGTSQAALTVKVTTNTIDGIAGATGFVMYPGEVRLVQCDGTNYHTVVINPFTIATTSTETIVIPPGYTGIQGQIWGAGGSGGAGATDGGGGGGGGSYMPFTVMNNPSVTITGLSLSLTVGAGGTSQTSANTAGRVGGISYIIETAGNAYELAFAYGGGGGGGGSLGAGGGGAGNLCLLSDFQGQESTNCNGNSGSTTSAGTGGQGFLLTNGVNGTALTDIWGGSGGSSAANHSGSLGAPMYGGGGGGDAVATTGRTGLFSVYGGGGGGGASNITGGAGSLSIFGGAGGAGGSNGAGTVGSVPGGGGGGAVGTVGSGAGGSGEIIMTGIF